MPSVVTRLSVMVPSCPVRADGSPLGVHLVRMSRRITADDLHQLLLGRHRKLDGISAGSGFGLSRLAGSGASAAAPVDKQPVHRIGRVVQGGGYRGQVTERLPLLLSIEQYL